MAVASTSSFKVESGIQLLARLSKKPLIENFYPVLFEDGPKQNDVIEIYSEDDITYLLVDITCAALLPKCLKGAEAGVLIFNCSGHINYNILISCLRNKIKFHLDAITTSNNFTIHDNSKEIDDLLEKNLNKLFIVEIYDTSQFYTTIHNLENILMEHSDISMVIFDNITAFYWSEQTLKIIKMDTYLKKILHKIQRVTKEYKVTIIYTRPEHFSSTKDTLESLEPCCENPTLERINYRIQVLHNNNDFHKVNIKTFKKLIVKQYCIKKDHISWE